MQNQFMEFHDQSNSGKVRVVSIDDIAWFEPFNDGRWWRIVLRTRDPIGVYPSTQIFVTQEEIETQFGYEPER